jgi:hypothetical protein
MRIGYSCSTDPVVEVPAIDFSPIAQQNIPSDAFAIVKH